jgi:predicted  nucleic acid-binding Zn-ribbon protein
MTHFVYISIILGLAGLVVLYAYGYEQQRQSGLRMIEDYASLEQGMTEVTDAYETDSLQYEESLQKAFEKNQHLEHILREALDKIADLNGQKLDLQTGNNQLKVALDDTRQAALDLQVIVTRHNENCLPLLEVVNEILAEPFAIEELENKDIDVFDTPDCEQ